MNSFNLTLVVGAGASKEVDMPIGSELKDRIRSALSFRLENGIRVVGGNQTIYAALRQASQAKLFPGADINSYLRACRTISAAMPQAESIDNFIDSHRNDPLIAFCGKLAIAACILESERASKLWSDPRTGESLSFEAIEKTWFATFFRALVQSADVSQIESRLSLVRIICFNYDRCIERYLIEALQNYYQINASRAKEIALSLKILHPYGQAGDLANPDHANSAPFGHTDYGRNLVDIAQSLRTFTEGVSKDSSDILAIRDSVKSAKIIFFLGFAYHELNLRVLFDHENVVANPARVYGSALGISPANLQIIRDELVNLGGLSATNISTLEFTAAQTLNAFSRAIRL